MAVQQPVKPLSNEEIASFCGQMAMVLKSGISSIEGISIMMEDVKTDAEKEILRSMEEAIMNTGSFHEALKAANIFPPYMLHMADIGEQAGKLDDVMQSLSNHYERESYIASSIKNAVAYPLVMVSMMVIIILVLIMKVVPIFSQVFEQLGQSMSGISNAFLKMGTMLNRYSIILVVIAIILIAAFLFGFYTDSGRKLFARLAVKLGITKKLNEKICSLRFASGMALTLSSGLDPDQSLKLTAALVENDKYEEKILRCQTLLSEGSDFSMALTSCGIFSGIYARMVTVGFKTGTLDEVMQKIAGRYENEIDEQISHIISTLEPTLVAVLSVIVGVILLSVMLPLIGIMSSF